MTGALGQQWFRPPRRPRAMGVLGVEVAERRRAHELLRRQSERETSKLE
jgi:hypothetical protein